MPPLLLDLTRLVSRQGHGALTGVDRVELAWLDHMLAQPGPCWGLVRTAIGFLLLDRRGAEQVARMARGEGPDATDLMSRLTRADNPARGRAEAALRRVSLARVPALFLARALLRHLPHGVVYLNVGHANVAHPVMRAVRRVPAARIAVLVHDTIPLDHPEFTRAGMDAVFARKLAVVAAHADLVIHSTNDARRKTEAHLAAAGRVPQGVTAPLGVPVPVPDGAPPISGPYVMALGTIEPRKNHALLLDVWDGFAASGQPVPTLVIVGARGWADPALLARLDARPKGVVELPGLNDGAVAALLQGAAALVFPSFAEGYGLPPVEAAALGIPVLCSNLDVVRELLGDYPVYLNPSDRLSWANSIGAVIQASRQPNRLRHPVPPPDWAGHFSAVLTVL
jgi:glycosyltransferase involved in cell wall biosynthesis